MSEFLTTTDLPFCKGCGHHHATHSTVTALEKLAARPLDVVLVTDIGCHGIVDKSFATHTVHGLHGRSVAIATGIAMGIEHGLKVVVFIGDGGATIGLQHLLEGARLNVDLTVVVHNNMLYGMTGGQPSGLTPPGFRTVITPDGGDLPKHDLPKLVLDAGAPYASRVVGVGDFSDALREAMEVEGFSLVEVLELCTSYTIKRNPEFRLKTIATEAGHQPGVWRGADRPAFRLPSARNEASLLDVATIERSYSSGLDTQLAVTIAGSAGEGVQSAAELLVQAAMACGLHATKKGLYPVTVGVGFSIAEVVLSPTPILFHGVSRPDVAIVTSDDGLRRSAGTLRAMSAGTVWIDESLGAPETTAFVRTRPFRAEAGAKSAALLAVLTCVADSGIFPVEALNEAVRRSGVGAKLPGKVLEAFGRV